MLNEIEIFNVQFGDCFIFKSFNTRAAMLVDFGSKQNINSNIKQKVEAELSKANEKNLMITHFHQDHYNGVQLLNNNIIFNEVYLPNFFSESIIRLHIALLHLLNPANVGYTIAMNLLSIIPNLCAYIDRSSVIYYVKRGENISNGTGTYRILWPDNSNQDEIADELYRDIINFYGILEQDEEFNQLTNRYMENFPRIDTNNGRLTMKFKEKSVDTMHSILGLLGNTHTTEKARIRLSRQLSNRISDFQNKLSICFDNIADSDKYKSNKAKSILFLSDVSPKSFNAIAMAKDGPKLHRKYGIIKAPHHGTRDYFVKNLPRSKYIIISNGNRKGWLITPLYGYIYAKRKLICTNYENTCEYHISGKRCPAYYSNLKLFSRCALYRMVARYKCICGIGISHKIFL